MSEDTSLQDGRAALPLFGGWEVDNRHADESRRDGYVGPGTALVGMTMIVDGDPRTGLFTGETAPQIARAQGDTQASRNAAGRARRGASR